MKLERCWASRGATRSHFESVSAEFQLNRAPPSDDSDPAETLDWLESLEAVTRRVDADRSKYLLQQLEARAQELGIRTLQSP